MEYPHLGKDGDVLRIGKESVRIKKINHLKFPLIIDLFVYRRPAMSNTTW
jgi:hypothetical protein